MTAAAAWLVVVLGPELPLYDDYAIVPALVGEQPITPSYLWSLHNEHRVPLPRLVLLVAYPIFGNDFRAGMYLVVACLAILSAILMATTRRIRNGWSYADAFFPIALLNWGHYNNLLWSWQVTFGLSTLIGLGAAALIADGAKRSSRTNTATLGVLLGLLPLCGAGGLAMVPPLALWMIVLGVSRIGSKRPGGWTAICATVPGVLLTVLYFVDYERPAQLDRAPGLAPVVRTAVQFLSLGVGPIGPESWPIGGGIVAGLTVSTTLLLLATGLKRPGERSRALGLLAVLAGFGLLTLGLAWGRAGSGDRSGLEPRYVTLAVQVPCLAMLAWSIYGPIILRRLATMVLLSASLVLLWPNTEAGLVQARQRREQSDVVLAEIRSGAPPYLLAARHSGFLHSSHDELTLALPMLGRARIGVFRDLAPDPSLRAVPLGDDPAAMVLSRWEPSTWTIEATGVDPWVTFTLPGRTRVAGIRIRYAHANANGTAARFKLGWRRSDQPGFPQAQQYDYWTMPTGDDRVMVAWIDATIDELRIQPDNRPCTFQIKELTLLVPEGDSGRQSKAQTSNP